MSSIIWCSLGPIRRNPISSRALTGFPTKMSRARRPFSSGNRTAGHFHVTKFKRTESGPPAGYFDEGPVLFRPGEGVTCFLREGDGGRCPGVLGDSVTGGGIAASVAICDSAMSEGFPETLIVVPAVPKRGPDVG